MRVVEKKKYVPKHKQKADGPNAFQRGFRSTQKDGPLAPDAAADWVKGAFTGDNKKKKIKAGKKKEATMSDENNKVNEGLGSMAHAAEKDHEVQMARSDLYKIAKYAIKLHEMMSRIDPNTDLESWIQAKITKAADYLDAVYHHMDYEAASMAVKMEQRERVRQARDAGGDEYKDSLSERLAEMAKKKQKSGAQQAQKPSAGGPAKPRDPNAVAAKLRPGAGAHGASTKSKAAQNKKAARGKVTVEEAQLNEAFPLLIPALAAAVRLGAPVVGRLLSKQGAKQVAKQVAKNTSKAAVVTGKIVVKNPGKSLAAYGAYEVWDTVTDAMDFLKELGLDEALIPNLAKVIVRYGIPTAAVLAALYGGKKLYDYVKDNNEPEEEEILAALEKEYGMNSEDVSPNDELDEGSPVAELKKIVASKVYKKKGSNGKACWDGYRYNGTKNGKDVCVKVKSEAVEPYPEIERRDPQWPRGTIIKSGTSRYLEKEFRDYKKRGYGIAKKTKSPDGKETWVMVPPKR